MSADEAEQVAREMAALPADPGNGDNDSPREEWLDERLRLVSRRLVEALAALRRVRAMHRDVGPGQGFTEVGYEDVPHSCGTCGTHDEYAVAWPCATADAAGAAS